jgi:uncharacterized membrane protein
VVYYNPSTKEVTYGGVASPTSVVNGTSNVSVVASGNVNISAAGTANVMKVSSLGMILTGTMYVTSTASFNQIIESFQTITGATGTVAHDCTNSLVFVHNSIAGNFTAALQSVPASQGTACVVTLFLNQGATAYIPNALTIAAVSRTIKWQGGTVPTGNANKLDVVAFTIITTGAGVYLVTGQLVSYG